VGGIDHGGRGLGLERFVQGSWKPFRQPGLDGSKLAIVTLFWDRDRALWVGTWDRGIYRIRGSRVDHFSSAEGLSSNTIYNFYQDRERNIWVATSQGIDCFRDIPVVSFSMEEGLSRDNVVSALVAHDGTVWVGNAGVARCNSWRNGIFNSDGPRPPRESSHIFIRRSRSKAIGRYRR
jgi:ligand-binding sensor domain-containing protein